MEPQPTQCTCGDFSSPLHFDTLKVIRMSQTVDFVAEFHATDGRECATFVNGELSRKGVPTAEPTADTMERVLAGLQASV